MLLDYGHAEPTTRRARRLLATGTKLCVAVLTATFALRLAYGHGYRDGYWDGGEAERVRHTPPPTPLSELGNLLPRRPSGATELRAEQK